MAYAFGHPKLVPSGSSRNVPCVAAEAALLIVDVQEYCSRPGHGCHSSAHRSDKQYFFDRVDKVIVPSIASLLHAARRAGVEVIYTVIEALTSDGRDASLDYKLSGPLFVPKGHANAAVLPEIAPVGDEIIIPKTSCSVFCSTNIHYILRNLGTRYLILCGQLTNQCVESAVRDAADLGYLVTVPEDACAANTEADHSAALKNMRGFARLLRTEALVKELSEQCLSKQMLEPSPSSHNPTPPKRLCHLKLCSDPCYGAKLPSMLKEMFEEISTVAFEIVDFDVQAGDFPQDCSAFCGFIIMGSPSSVSVGVQCEPWIDALLGFLRRLFREQRSVVGVCFGHQAIARALGGVVAVNPAGTQSVLKSYSPNASACRALGVPSDTAALKLLVHHSDAVVGLPQCAESWGYGLSGHWGMTIGNSCLTTQAHPEFSTPTGRLVMRGILEYERQSGHVNAGAFTRLSVEELDMGLTRLDAATDHKVLIRAFAQCLSLVDESDPQADSNLARNGTNVQGVRSPELKRPRVEK